MRQGPVTQQIGKDFAWAFDKERVLVVVLRKQRFRYRGGFRRRQQFIAGTPERHSLVQWIQDHVAALGIVKLRNIFERRIVDDGAFATIANLQKYLANQSGFAASVVAHNKDVAVLDL